MQLNTISDIQIQLHTEALNTGFYSQTEQELNDNANAFVEDFCLRNGLAWHAISPMCWSFESAEQGMFNNGVIELKDIDNNKTQFIYQDVSEAKITDPE